MKITRRTALRGAAAVAATGAVPVAVLASTNNVNADAELFALYEKCRRLEKKHLAAIKKHDEVWIAVVRQFPKCPVGAQLEAQTEAEKRAGCPALEKKQDAAQRAWADALDRLYDMRTHTPQGMILKFTAEWGERSWRNWQAKDYSRVEFPDDAMASVLLDLERLAGDGRAI